jgi:uncharacterized protein (TIGR00296 family)
MIGVDFMIEFSLEDGEFLVKVAREAIKTWLKYKRKISFMKDAPEKTKQNYGVFVTLTKAYTHELRGCIGYPFPVKPLVEATIESAIEAATGDPRFKPVTLEELESNIIVEVSILTPPKLIEVENPMDYPKKIVIGEDGLIVEKGFFKGLLLPQVAVEWNMDAEEFLSNCCLKAGLPPDAWLNKEVKISKFQAVIFAEETPNGKIIKKDLKKLL